MTSKTSIPLPVIPYRRAPLVFLLLVLCVVAITWPWATHFSSEFADHWDPPFHAWKLWYVADAIMHGHLLPPNANTNMYYPNSCALYYEALHWPQAIFAAVLLPFIHNPVLVYHVTLVAFWALAGVFIWMLLLALDVKRPAALFGAVVFTILPYRTSYYVEFNMQLCFGLPMFLFFLVRYFQRPAIGYACGAAAALVLQAASELYQAVFLLFVLPFLLVPLLRNRWRLLLSRKKFLYPLLAATALGLVATFLLLSPYLSLLSHQTLARSIGEVHTHRLEPFSYLSSARFCRWRLLPPVNVRHDEMCVYPTLVILLLTMAFLIMSLKRNFNRYEPWSMRIRTLALCRKLRIVLLAAFFLLALICPRLSQENVLAGHLYGLLPILICGLSVIILFLAAHKTIASEIMEGLFAGAIFSLFMSFGPMLRGPGDAFVENVLYGWSHAHIPALHGFRVISRFSVFPMIFATLASSIVLSSFLRNDTKHQKIFSCLWIPLVLLVACESVPNSRGYRDASEIPSRPESIQALEQSGTPFVLAVVPFGNRYTDSMDMLRIGGTSRTLVYAWGGTYPDYTRRLLEAEKELSQDARPFHQALAELWPDCFPVLTPNLTTEYFSRWKDKSDPVSFRDALESIAEPVASDREYTVYKLLPLPASTNFVKRVRQDFVLANDELCVSVRPEQDATDVSVGFNGHDLGTYPVPGNGRELSIPYRAGDSIPIQPNDFTFSSKTPFSLSGFHLRKTR